MSDTQSPQQSTPSLTALEQFVNQKEYEKACRELIQILRSLGKHFGETTGIEFDTPHQLANLEKEKLIYFCSRMANAITQLFSDPELELSETGTLQFLSLQRWMSFIFASSPFINADHILQTYNCNPKRTSSADIHLDGSKQALMKFCILFFGESNINLNLNDLWQQDPKLCASLCFALQSPRFIGTESAFHKRAKILQWFPDHLAQLTDLSELPSAICHDVYMHCSYDTAPNKHDVKRSLNKVIRGHLIKEGWQDREIQSIGYIDNKPVMVVLLEHFHRTHSIYRTHSTSLIAARQHFHLVGIGHSALTDEAGGQVFNEFHTLSGDLFEDLRFIRDCCNQHQAAVFYMPSIGMDMTTIFASNTRLAPIQAVALGHPATTHSDFIDYVVVEEDYVGSADCFSETLICLPTDALPYVPSAATPDKVEYKLRANPEVVNIGIASTTMKLNPQFLTACREIRDRAKVKVHFHFALGQSQGITHPYVEKFIRTYLGESATAHPHSAYKTYLEVLRQCDMMINPFPFGNTNGIIDMVTLGLVGICKTGAEVHEHIDEGLFARLGLPKWLVANTKEEYIEQAIRLAENHEERLALRRYIIENNRLQTLFSGNPAPMGERFLALVQAWQASMKPNPTE